MEILLVAVDGSRHSAKVVDHAIKVAKSLGARILLVNVAPDVPVPGGYAEYAREEKVDPSSYYEKVSQGILEQMGRRISQAGLQYDAVRGIGNPVGFILGTAESSKATMIVLGITGLHKIASIGSLGSVSRRVVENSTIPVVLVP